jgi:hypothetical protein
MSQVVEFFAAPGQTVTAQLYSAGDDTLVSSQSATEATNRKGVYTATYTGVAAGTYRVLALVGSTPIATWWVDLLTGSATYIAYEMPLAVQVASVYNASPSAGWTNGSFGDRLLISASAQRTVSVTGSNHIASAVHSMEPDVMTASALASDAVLEIATAVEATQALSRLDSMIESDGAGQFRFDTIALSMAPAGGGGGSGDASQATLLLVKAKTDLITVGQVQYTSPVSPIGNIATPILAGDDYKASIGNAFTWTINARTGYSVSTATCRFGGSSEDTGDGWNVSGTVSDLGGGEWQLSFDLPKATTSTLSPGFYRWSVELVNPGGDEVTEVYNSNANRQVEVRAKQT